MVYTAKESKMSKRKFLTLVAALIFGNGIAQARSSTSTSATITYHTVNSVA
jgi:hypothetical protein